MLTIRVMEAGVASGYLALARYGWSIMISQETSLEPLS